MFEAVVTCPVEECAAADGAVGSLEELEALVCECGCALVVERIAESERELDRDEAFELVMLG
jgi:hypothetical protein